MSTVKHIVITLGVVAASIFVIWRIPQVKNFVAPGPTS